MKTITRRSFITRSTLGSAAIAAGTGLVSAPNRVLGANERIVLGIMGIGGRGSVLATTFPKQPGVELAYVCDADSNRLKPLAAKVEEIQGKSPKVLQDFRKMLEDKAVDAIINATPDHWHSLGTILACQAGKHVYVEKPASHNIWEGRKAVEAARKYNRVVQLGTQTRSGAYAQHGVAYIAAGKLGKVHMIKVFNMKTRPPIEPRPNRAVPEGVDYDLWLGPAPQRPFNPNDFSGGYWNWKWDFSGGDIINDGVHQMDLARWCSGQKAPRGIHCAGGIFEFTDGQDTPDTQVVTYDFDGLTMIFELTLWTPYLKKIPQWIRDGDYFPKWPFCATRVEVYGTDGFMYFGRHGGGWQVFTDEDKAGDFEYGRDPVIPHIQNFLECVKSGKRPNADIEEGHLSTVLCHLGNISYRLGGRKLQYDPIKERFIGDEEANALLKRTYRAPWVVPEVV